MDDLHRMMDSGRSMKEFAQTRSARYQLHPSLSPDFNGVWDEEGRIEMENFLEEIMYQVPGECFTSITSMLHMICYTCTYRLPLSKGLIIQHCAMLYHMSGLRLPFAVG